MCLANTLPDNKAEAMLVEKNGFDWRDIYKAYGAIMYGNILHVTQDKMLAEEVFINAFKKLQSDNQLIPIHCKTSIFLAVYVKKFATSFMLNKAS